MKRMTKYVGLALVALALFTVPFGLTGCAGGGVSRTSVYQGDSFLFQTEKLSVQAHDLFLEFYRWEKEWRNILPVSVSRAADFARLNESKWAGSLNAAHDAYVATPTAENKDKLQLALNLLKTALDQAAFYMVANKELAPNQGLDKENNKTLKALGLEPKQ
jgi:hypothetical protein